MTFVTGCEPYGNRNGQIQDQGYAFCTICRRLIERIRYFDENFRPTYCEDADHTQRIAMLGIQNSIDPRCLLEHERSDTTRNDPILSARHEEIARGCREYVIAKWGGDAGHATFASPSNPFGPQIEFADRAPPYGPGRGRVFEAQEQPGSVPAKGSWLKRLIGR